jgi:beta-lactamase superfamily II metal-dependent hydrolase
MRVIILLLAASAALFAAKNLEIYFIDVEGGQSTLFVSPSGESMLVDTGYAGHNNRDATRILAAAKAAGVKKIDYLVITHFHPDHAGGVPQLAERIPILNYIDKGGTTETGQDQEVLFNAYSAFRDKAKHTQVKPGDTVPVKGLDVRILAASTHVLDAPLPGAGQPNPECGSFRKQDDTPGENNQSLGLVVTYGDFRLLDLGDLTWNNEFGLVCPENKIGRVSAYLMSHHGGTNAGSPQLVHATGAQVAVMNNGPRKGGSPASWQTVHDTKGIEDIWQLHYAVETDKQHNSSDTFIANVDEICEGKWLRITAQNSGAFTVYNSRNKYEKGYTH